MTSVDSGVETENDSNDSLATHDSSMDLSPSIRPNNAEMNLFDNKEPVPSTSSEAAKQESSNDSSMASTSNTPSSSTSSASVVEESAKEDESEDESKQIRFRLGPSIQFRLPATLKPNFSSGIDPPAGLTFVNVTSYDVIGNGYSVLKPKMRLKMSRRFNKASRESTDPFAKYSERKLRRAVSTNNTDLVQRLLNSGVDPNSHDELRRSPLHLAACRGYTEILQMLLQKGANPNQQDSMGNTPLHLAACTNHVSVVTLLLRAGTDVHSSDHFGRSPLQLAQTRLRLLQKSTSSSKTTNPDAWQVKTEVQKVIEMMLAYLNRFGAPEADAELLSSFSSRLTLSQTSQEVDQELRGLLASLSSLSIDKPTTS